MRETCQLPLNGYPSYMGRGQGEGAGTAGAPTRRPLYDESDVLVLSPDATKLIKATGSVIYEQLQEEAARLAQGTPFNDLDLLDLWLPGCYASHYTPALVLRFAAAVESVTEKLAAYEEDRLLNSTIEELAGHAILNGARDTINDLPELASEYGVEDLDLAAEDIADLKELAFWDDDVSMLFDASIDGFEDSPDNGSMGFVNLNFSDWFKTFAPEKSGGADELYTTPAPLPTWKVY